MDNRELLKYSIDLHHGVIDMKDNVSSIVVEEMGNTFRIIVVDKDEIVNGYDQRTDFIGGNIVHRNKGIVSLMRKSTYASFVGEFNVSYYYSGVTVWDRICSMFFCPMRSRQFRKTLELVSGVIITSNGKTIDVKKTITMDSLYVMHSKCGGIKMCGTED